MKRVLIVEDLKVDRFVMTSELSGDYHVTALSSAEKACAFAHRNIFNIALINVMLRDDLDCIPLLHSLQKIKGYDFLAIAISCYVDEERYFKIREAGFTAVLQKPLDKFIFQNLIVSLPNSATPVIKNF